MHVNRTRERAQVIATFQSGYDTALATFGGGGEKFMSNPPIVILGQPELCQGIICVRVEASRNQQNVRIEIAQARQNHPLEGVAKFCRSCPGRQGSIDDVSDTNLARRTCSRIERRLMAGCVEQVFVRLEHVLGTVPVMDVEIHHGCSLEAVRGAGMKGADRDTVEQAKSHGASAFGMMARRTDGAKRVTHRLLINHGIHGRRDGTRPAQGRFSRKRRNDGIRIQVPVSGSGNRGKNGVHVTRLMDQRNLFDRGQWRLAPRQIVK